MAFISVFDVIGPNMVGPSSSHTAGAASIALLAGKMLGERIKSVKFILNGSFAATYNGHGTDRALLGGIMGFATDDVRIRDSFEYADKAGIEYSFEENTNETDIHPNTVDIVMTGEGGRRLTVRGESLGGGKVMLTRINGVKVQFTGEYHALIAVYEDHPGVVAAITAALNDNNVNIAFLRVYREKKGGRAYTIVESDEEITAEAVEKIRATSLVDDIMLIRR